MKKLIIGALALTAIFAGEARTLSPEEALQRVEAGTSAQAKAVARTSPALVAEGDYEGTPTYYVFSSDKSALIVSASSCATPVLGYLDNPVTSTTGMPEQLKWWLNGIGSDIAKAEATPAPEVTYRTFSIPGVAVNAIPGLVGTNKAQQVRKANKSDIAPMLKVYWDQGDPYDMYVPEEDGEKCAAGCVATATAMVMKHYNYPAKGTGVVSTTYKGSTLSLDLSAKAFDWDNMLSKYDNTATTAQREAVGYLMQAVGYAVKMQYGSSSSATTMDAVVALVDNFGYDKGVGMKFREYCTNEEWEDLVYAELQTGRPILYAGSGTDGGHQFVCDGYRANDGFFHFNWGWSGSYDGYYTTSYLVPEWMGTGGNSDGFNQYQSIVTGVRPAVSGSVAGEPWMGLSGGKLSGSVSGRRVTIAPTDDGVMLNQWYRTTNYDLGIVISDASGNILNTYSIASNTSLDPYYGWASFWFNLPNSVGAGTYHVYPVYRVTNSGKDWAPIVISPYDPQYLVLTVSSSGTLTIAQGPSSERPVGPQTPGDIDGDEGEQPDPDPDPDPDPTLKNWVVNGASTSTGFTAGSTFNIIVNTTNPNSVAQTLTLAAVPIDSSNRPIGSYDEYFRSYTLGANETKDLTFYGEINADVPAGEYIVLIIDQNLKTKMSFRIEISAAPEEFSIFNMYPVPEELVPGTSFYTTVICSNTTSSAVGGNMDIHLCTTDAANPNTLYTHGIVGTTSISVAAGEVKKTYNISCSLPSDTPVGQYYLAAIWSGSLLAVVPCNVVSETGVNDIEVDEVEGDPVYYDLQGRQVNGDPAPGIYLRRTGAKVSKVLIK